MLLALALAAHQPPSTAAVAEAAGVSVTVSNQITQIRAGFVSFNIDFDNRPRQLQAGFHTVNYSDARLVAAAAALAPAALRVGGGDEDKTLYGVGDYAPRNCSSAYDPWTVRNASVADCMRVTPARYAELFAFAAAAGLRLVFAFNPLYGLCCHGACLGHCDRPGGEAAKPLPGPAGCGAGPCRPWDSSNTEAMLQHMKATAQVPWAVQLGNEQGNGIAPYRCSTGATARPRTLPAPPPARRRANARRSCAGAWHLPALDPAPSSAITLAPRPCSAGCAPRAACVAPAGRSGATTAASFMRLDNIITKIWPAGNGPVIMGPDAGGGQYLSDFWAQLQARKRTSLLKAFTYHSYSSGSAESAGRVARVSGTNGGRGPRGLRNATVLDWYGASGFEEDVAPVVAFNRPASHTESWIGEMASAPGGGTPGVSDRYASLFFYIDSLSAAAAANFSGFLRQDLAGASYGLVQGCARTTGGAGTSEPAPSWSAYNKRYGWVPDVGTCTPNPDYWGALLWRRLMGEAGQRVMNVSAAFAAGAGTTLRAYGHCGVEAGASRGDLTLVLINLLNETSTVALPNAGTAATPTSVRRTDYVLTPGEPPGGWAACCVGAASDGHVLDETKTPVVRLNGRALAMRGNALPAMPGVAATGAVVVLPPMAVAFVVVHGSASCA